MLDYLETALQMEVRGKNFYDDVIEKCSDKAAKEIFKMLRDDEVVHFNTIKKIYQSIKSDKSDINFKFKLDNAQSSNEKLNLFFKKLRESAPDKRNNFKDELGALEIGIKFEKEAVEFYSTHLKIAKSDEERDFLKQMIEEEKKHFQALSDLKLFYQDPDAFFREMEHSGLDGA